MLPALAAAIVAAGIGLAWYGYRQKARSRREHLMQLLEIELADPSVSPAAISGLMEKAGAFAGRALGKTSTGDRITAMVTRAGSSLRMGEFVAMEVVASLASAVIGLLLTRSEVAALAAAAGAPLIGLLRLDSKGRRRVQRVEEQLPSVLQLLATSLDAGSSVLSALRLAAEEGDPPLAPEFKRVVAETEVGRPLIESLEAMALRIGSQDIEWSIEAIRIQSQTGGRLADTLRVLAEFMRARLEVRGEVRALSAEARLSAKVLTGLPFVVGAYLFAFRRSYLEPMLTSGLGKMMVWIALFGIVAGSLWMRRMARVEV